MNIIVWDKLGITNLAFNKLSQAKVNDVIDSGAFADSASDGFDLLYQSTISSKSWRFATTTQQLTLLPDRPPITRWNYQFNLPADYLAAVRIWPFSVPYQIYKRRIYSNTQFMQLEYRFLPDPTELPAYYVHYLACLIAAWYADTAAQDEKLSAKLNNDAEVLLGEALFCDAQSHPTESMENNPIVQCRYDIWGMNGRYPY